MALVGTQQAWCNWATAVGGSEVRLRIPYIGEKEGGYFWGWNRRRLEGRAIECQTGTTLEFRPLWDLIELISTSKRFNLSSFLSTEVLPCVYDGLLLGGYGSAMGFF